MSKRNSKYSSTFFIDCDLEDPDENSVKTHQEIMVRASDLPPFNFKELEVKDPRYKKIYKKFDNENICTGKMIMQIMNIGFVKSQRL